MAVAGAVRGRRRARKLNRQSCDRDYNSRKERADAAEHQNIVDFDHGIPPAMVGATVVRRRPSCNHLSATGLAQS
jgi:hypothetical protein